MGKMQRIRFVALLMLVSGGNCVSLAGAQGSAAQESVQFRESFSAAAELKAGQVADNPTSATGELSQTISGGETSECDAGSDRASKAMVSTNAMVVERAPESLTIALKASANANGGHWRTCSACPRLFGGEGICVGIHGNDSEGFASARSTGVVRVRLPPSSDDARFVVRIVPTDDQAEDLQFVLTDPDIGALLTNRSPSREATVPGGAERELQLIADLRASAVDAGGCCSSKAEESARVRIEVVRTQDHLVSEAQQLVANSQDDPVPHIAGGQVETGYHQVGALLFDGPKGELCTATVIARRTLITAAHCVRGKATNRLTFVAAPTINAKDSSRVFQVTDVVVPDGKDSGFNYDALIYADDIALAYVDRPLSLPEHGDTNKLSAIPIVALHSGAPKLKDLAEEGHRLLFMGFGYDDLDGRTGRGIKRRVEMQIAKLGSTTFKNEAPGQNTCAGDSGGPVLLVENSGLTLVGVVSTGDRLCKNYGINTRIDAFAGWLQGRLKD